MTNHANGPDAAGEGTVDHRLDRLAATLEAMGGTGEQRREILVERAEERGLGRPEAEQAYDIAREERLEPAYGLALVLEGVSVRPFTTPRPDVETSEPREPEWVDAPPEPGMAERERRLRQTFRRFRSRLEEEGGMEQAVRTFARELDVEAFDYRAR